MYVLRSLTDTLVQVTKALQFLGYRTERSTASRILYSCTLNLRMAGATECNDINMGKVEYELDDANVYMAADNASYEWMDERYKTFVT